MAKKFKYQNDIDSITAEGCVCPSDVFAISQIDSFRFVFEDINHPYNFLPQLKQQPTRFNSQSSSQKCKFLSLSFYSDIKNARQQYEAFKSNFPNFPVKVGNCIANGVLNSNDGLASEEDVYTHFDFYEFEDADLRLKFKIIDQL